MTGSFVNGGDGGTATTHDWLTPPEILEALGPFDMDPCASQFQPWRTAATQFTIEDDGLSRDWVGRVWCNPPYGPHAEKFLKRMAEHGNGICLIFARTETKSFQQHVLNRANGILFIAGRLSFRLPGGAASGRAGAPSVLIAYGLDNLRALRMSGIDGHVVELHNQHAPVAADLFTEVAQ